MKAPDVIATETVRQRQRGYTPEGELCWVVYVLEGVTRIWCSRKRLDRLEVLLSHHEGARWAPASPARLEHLEDAVRWPTTFSRMDYQAAEQWLSASDRGTLVKLLVDRLCLPGG